MVPARRCIRRQCIFIASLSLISVSHAFIKPKQKEESENLRFFNQITKSQQLFVPDEIPTKQGELDLSSLDRQLNELPDIEAQFFFDEAPMKFHMKNATVKGWFGEDDEHGNAINLINNRGKFHGSVNFDDKIYSINTLPNGSTRVSEINVRDLPPEDYEHGGGRHLSLEHSSNLRGPKPLEDRKLEERDSGDRIDIMCIYTMNAMCAEAGYGNTNRCENSQANREPMDSKCQLAVEETNFAYAESGVETRLHLVYTGPVNYEDLSPRGYSNMLDQITHPNDSIMDDVHVWREQYHADLVALISENKSACGLAWMFNGDPSSGFSVIYRKCMTGYYSFGHEVGHNFGCTHDRDAKGHNDRSTHHESNYGYRDPQSRFRDIMAYDCPGRCTKVQRFSNTKSTIVMNGQQVPVGTQYDDCAQQINNARVKVANFMKSTTLQPKEMLESLASESDSSEPTYLGCYNDVANDRALEIFAGENMNFETCRKACTSMGTPVFGLEAKGECWCGSGGYKKHGQTKDCHCGAGNVGDWKFCAFEINDFEGCYNDNYKRRALEYYAGDGLGWKRCKKICKAKGYHFMGRQGNNECWCGGSSPSDTSYAVHGSADCGNCGGGGALEPLKMCVHRVFLATFKGCWKDNRRNRALSFNAGKHMSHDQCLTVCKKLGFHYMGRQGWGECWCSAFSPDDLSYQEHGREIGCGCASQYIGSSKLCVHQIPHRE